MGKLIKQIEMPCGDVMDVWLEANGTRTYSYMGLFHWEPHRTHRVILMQAMLEEDRFRYTEKQAHAATQPSVEGMDSDHDLSAPI